MGSTFFKFFSLFKICCNFFGFRIALSRRVCYATYIYINLNHLNLSAPAKVV